MSVPCLSLRSLRGTRLEGAAPTLRFPSPFTSSGVVPLARRGLRPVCEGEGRSVEGRRWEGTDHAPHGLTVGSSALHLAFTAWSVSYPSHHSPPSGPSVTSVYASRSLRPAGCEWSGKETDDDDVRKKRPVSSRYARLLSPPPPPRRRPAGGLRPSSLGASPTERR